MSQTVSITKQFQIQFIVISQLEEKSQRRIMLISDALLCYSTTHLYIDIVELSRSIAIVMYVQQA
jgi:hypothetical protein